MSQPVLAFTAVTMLWLLHMLTLHTAIWVLAVTMTIQLGYAYYWCCRTGLAPGRARAKLVGPLSRYGLSQLAAVAPATVNTYLDQLVLSQLVPPADLGRYAIAVSATLVPVPLVSAIGNVAFPQLAARRNAAPGGSRLQFAAVVVSAGLATAVLLPIAASAYWLIPAVFGTAYRGAVPLLWLLSPGGIFLACGQVAGDLLRGINKPGLVAVAQGLAAVFTVLLLITLLPSMGVTAAAVASTVSYGIALAMMIHWLRRPPRTRSARHRRACGLVSEVLRVRTCVTIKEKLLRIGIIGLIPLDSFAANIMDGLRRMGHDPVSVGSSLSAGGRYVSAATAAIRNLLPAFDERGQRHIARAAIEAECEIVINVEQRLMPSVVQELQRNGIRVGIWFPDAVLNMGRQLMLLAPYDALFVKEPHVVDRLRAVIDLPLFYLPQACNPRLHRPLTEPGTEPYLVIAGNMYPSRVRLLERLHAKGLPLRLYGADFPRWIGDTPLRQVHTGQIVLGEDKARVFRSAVAVLNTMHPAEVNGVNSRLFEAAGSGAAVLTEFRPTLPDLFAVGEEVLAFGDFDELIAQATRLLAEPGLSAKLGDAAAARAHESHTFEKRLPVILEKLS